MASCPACARPVARSGPSCLYCGAPLGAALPATADRPAEGRLLVVLDLAAARAEQLAQALHLGAYDAAQLARRGGLHLHRLADPGAARAEAQRLGGLGLVALLVPETEARTPPLLAVAGEWTGASLALRTEKGALVLEPAGVGLVVTGDVVREYLPRYQRRRAEPTRAGHRWLAHLHLRDETAAVEIDPAILAAFGSLTASARLSVEAWLRALGAAGVPRDEGFRSLTPVLALAEPDSAQSPVAAAGALVVGERAPGEKEPRQLLDNRAQFRFYSGWRGAVERLRQRSPAARGAC